MPQTSSTTRTPPVEAMAADQLDRDRPATLLHLLGLIERGVQRELQARLGAHGLSVAEYACLSTLRVAPGLSNAELARRSLVTPQSMNEVVAKLQLRGLVERRSDPDHGRILRTQLSAAGVAVLTEVLPEVEAIEDALRGGASDAEVAQTTVQLVGVLGRLSVLQQHRI